MGFDTMERATYEEILASKFMPSNVVATRPRSPTKQTQSGWHRGRQRDLRHNCWLVRTSDPEKKRGDDNMIKFDGFVDFPRRSLAHDDFNSDRLSKKLLILLCLTLGPRDHGDLEGAYIAQISGKFDSVLRYRNAIDIGSFSEIAENFAEDLCELLSSHGAIGLLPIDNRLEVLASEERAGRWALPLLRTQEVDWIELAATLGTTRGAISRSTDFRFALIESFPDMNPRALAAIKRHLKKEAGEFSQIEHGLDDEARAAQEEEPGNE
jgi:hypothetical protein